MTTCPALTPAQRAAAKPWGMACLSLWVAEMLSIVTASVLLIVGAPIGLRVLILWVAGTLVVKRLPQMFLTHRLKRIVGPDWGPSMRSQWRMLAIEIALFTMFAVGIPG